MFCPNCGRKNPIERKFCVSCGTNLEIVSQALSGNADDFLTKTDNALDQFIARYAEHVFKDAPATAGERTIGKSWKILWQAVLTSWVDILLFSLMWNIIPLRFLILLISTPYKLIARRGVRGEAISGELVEHQTLSLPDSPHNKTLAGSIGSVTELTTDRFPEHLEARKEKASKDDSVE